MKSLLKLICVGISFGQNYFAQLLPESIKITTTSIGTSAISIKTITAKTFNFDYPISDFKIDSVPNQLIVSAKQKNEAGSQYFTKGIFAAISCSRDSVKWLNESSLSAITISGNNLILSNDVKSVCYNKLFGYDELKYPSKIIYTLPSFNRGFIYSRTENDLLNCVNLSTGSTVWAAKIPNKEDWVDTKFLNDSVLLIAANGLHAVSIKGGLLWSFPSVTSVTTNKSLIYSSAKYHTIQQISSVIRTSTEENLITQIASNILADEKMVYFASKEKLIATSHNGKMAWELDLKNYPVSKMLISKTDSSIILANFGLATHGENFIIWGKPFILTIDPENGKILNQYDLSNIENLVDFLKTEKSLIFAAKDGISEAKQGNNNLNTVLSLSGNKYGQFTEFINGNDYYTFKEGHFVPLNFINDNLIYFKTDNNKIYGIDGEDLKYEYHFTELFKFDKKYHDKTILVSQDKTLITSSNFELLYTLNLTDRSFIHKNKIYFLGERKIHVLNMDELK